jgi:hypothetical protein
MEMKNIFLQKSINFKSFIFTKKEHFQLNLKSQLFKIYNQNFYQISLPIDFDGDTVNHFKLSLSNFHSKIFNLI